MTRVERLYRIALRAYPQVYRAERGEEIIAVQLEVAGGRASGRELCGSMLHGWRIRVMTIGQDGVFGLLRSGVATAGFVLAILALAVMATGSILSVRAAGALDAWWLAVDAAAVSVVLALAIGLRRTATVAALALLVLFRADRVGLTTTPVPWGVGAHWLVFGEGKAAVPSNGGPFSLVLVVLVMATTARRGRLAPRPGFAVGGALVILGTAIGWVAAGQPTLFNVLWLPALALLALSLLLIPIDPRPAFGWLLLFPTLAVVANDVDRAHTGGTVIFWGVLLYSVPAALCMGLALWSLDWTRRVRADGR